MTTLPDRPDAYALRTMREKGEKLYWAAYQNPVDKHTKFLVVGEGSAYPEVPAVMPDVDDEDNSKYAFLGFVNLKTGTIETE